jgi:Zn finger protein HypA/HybF involved in hydrogenase expression
MYALCFKCGHEAPYLPGGVNDFQVFAEGVDIHKMPLHEAVEEDLKIECPKCASTDVQINDWPKTKR